MNTSKSTCILLITVSLFLLGLSHWNKSVIADTRDYVVQPIQQVVTSLDNFLNTFIPNLKMVQENTELRESIKKLEEQIKVLQTQVASLKSTNETLLMLYNSANPDHKLKLICSECAGYDKNTDTIRVNDDQIANLPPKNKQSNRVFAVDTKDYVTGSLIGILDSSSHPPRILPITHKSTGQIAVYVEVSPGVETDFLIRSTGNGLVFDLVKDTNSEIPIDSRVYTSGKGEMYPRGLFVGTVVENTDSPEAQGVVESDYHREKLNLVSLFTLDNQIT